jgi:hypothetical protein
MSLDRIETVYSAIDQMAKAHGKPKPSIFGGGKWNFDKEIQIWKEQIKKGESQMGGEPLSPLQWSIINSYIKVKRGEIKGVV